MTSRSKEKHPNRVPFEGVLTRLDVPSDKPPAGSRGHCVILTKRAAEECLHTLVGMAVGFRAEWDGHDTRQKCGVITEAYIVGDELRVLGHIFARDFPEVLTEMKHPAVALGMSYEMTAVHVIDMREAIWTLNNVTFTGAAILMCEKAAYKSTSISLEGSGHEAMNGTLVLTGIGVVKLATSPVAGRIEHMAGISLNSFKFVRWIRFQIRTARENRSSKRD